MFSSGSIVPSKAKQTASWTDPSSRRIAACGEGDGSWKRLHPVKRHLSTSGRFAYEPVHLANGSRTWGDDNSGVATSALSTSGTTHA